MKTILLLTISIRFIPRRIDLDCDFALDMLVTENLQFNSHVISTNKEAIISIEQQQRHEKRTNQNKQTNSAKKTLELLEHFMPQNRRIYNFGVKTLKQQPIGMKFFQSN